MPLVKLIQQEFDVAEQHLIFLRHSNSKTRKLAKFGDLIDEYTAVQDKEGRYDFWKKNHPRAELVVVIVNDRVRGVYKVRDAVEGRLRMICSPGYATFAKSIGKENPVSRHFDLERVTSGADGAEIVGWTGKRTPVVRGSSKGKMFFAVRVDAAPLPASGVRIVTAPGSGLRPSSAVQTAAGPARNARKDPLQQAVDHMLEMARLACDESGGERTAVSKVKRIEFSDDETFRLHVIGLIEQQGRRCKLSELPLQMPGKGADPEMAPSLDRIDSNGHYAEGNLQVVCRFINRWKSDAQDHEFRRLLDSVRRAPGRAR